MLTLEVLGFRVCVYKPPIPVYRKRSCGRSFNLRLIQEETPRSIAPESCQIQRYLIGLLTEFIFSSNQSHFMWSMSNLALGLLRDWYCSWDHSKIPRCGSRCAIHFQEFHHRLYITGQYLLEEITILSLNSTQRRDFCWTDVLHFASFPRTRDYP